MNDHNEYKDSGIEWIGEIPRHWDCKWLKHISIVKRGSSPRPIDDPKYFDENGEFSWVRIADVSASGKYLDKTTEKLSTLGSSMSTKMYPGDIFLSIAGTVGKPIITNIHCCIHDGFVWFENLQINTEFLYYSFLSGTCFQGLGKMGTQLNLNTDTVGNSSIPVPPEAEQKLISRYLDKKTSQIDSLINKIEKKIELLKEQRTSLINHYVTKGLDPNAKMKDSGIEWIGEIPMHWKVLKIKHVVKDGGFRSGPFGSALITNQLSDSGDWIVYSPENLRSDNVSDQLYVPVDRKEELEKYLVSVNDIVLPIVGSLNVSKVITENDKRGIINQRLCRISIDPHKANINYISFLFKFSNLIQNQIETEKKGSILDHITKEIIFNLTFPSPTDEKERDQLYEKVHSTNKNFRVLIDKSELRIKFLREYRQSLISSAVTGKLRITKEMI